MNKVINVTIIKGSVNSTMFIEFIKIVINKIQEDKVLFTEYIETVINKILYNVPYCSEFNPIEMVFSKVKSMVHKRTNNAELIGLHKNIKYGFNKITKSNLVGYYNKCFIFLKAFYFKKYTSRIIANF
jgi:transposase